MKIDEKIKRDKHLRTERIIVWQEWIDQVNFSCITYNHRISFPLHKTHTRLLICLPYILLSNTGKVYFHFINQF
jgi:hypothetical protein